MRRRVSRRRQRRLRVEVPPTTFRLPAKTYTIVRNGRVIVVHRPAQVVHRRGYTYYRRDVGRPGRGKKVIRLRPGAMTKWAVRLGYINEGQRIDDIPLSRIDDFALDLAEAVGPRRAWRMFHAQIVLRKNRTEPEIVQFRRKMEKARDAIAAAYESELAPREAIAAWKRMSPVERAMRIPGGEI